MVRAGAARFTVLDQGLLRLEYSADGAFEDRASLFAVARDAPAQDFRSGQGPGNMVWLKTERFRLEWRPDGLPFHAGNLSVGLLDRQGLVHAVWKPGLEASANLGGPLRTLDDCEGPIELGKGVLSRDGWALVDDSLSPLFSAVGGGGAGAWAAPRAGGRLDWYLFCYGLDHAAALRALAGLSGPVPLPPIWALGSWYSRYWPYSSQDLLDIARDYRANGFPLDVMVLDMDWHLDGWTGYTWNPALIPDPEDLLARLHALGLRATLNLHPAAGVGSHEAAYADFARALGRDPAEGATLPFDVADARFMRLYFDLLLHPLERQGVDFWWMDWQQGSASAMPGLDPLTWLNHLHYQDRQRPELAAPGAPAPRRGMNFSRWGGWGDHRHPVHFSGDTHSNWEVLEFLPSFTAASGNAGVAYWSHDLGGHFSAGKGVDPELSARWIQFGALSPVMRVHCSRDPSVDRRPWLHGEEHARAARKAFALRSRLLPYLYTSARQCHEAGLPLLRPMYLHYPDEDQAYASPQQYLIGEDLLASPVVRPGFGPGKLVHAKVWFPAGDWYHWETHQMFRGPLETVVPTDLDAMPLFVRGGAPVCLQDPGSQRVCDTHQPMVVRLYPGPAADRAHYEDDGESLAYQGGAWRKTPLCGNPLDGGGQLLVLGPAEGAQPAGAEFGAASPDAGGDGQSRRDWIVELPGHPAVDAAEGVVRGLERGLDGLTRVSLGPLGPKDRVELRVHWGGAHPADGLSQSLRALESRLGLAGRQLPQLHALAQELIGLAAEAQQAWQSLAREDAHRDGEALRRTAAWDALRDLRLRSGNLFDALAQGGHEFACRVLAGLSLQCVVLSAPGGACVLQVELRREAAELPSQTGISMGTGSGPLALAYRVEGGDWLEARVALEPSCVSVWNIALELDRGRLGWTRGAVRLQVDLEGAQSGRSMTLSEPFAWDGRVVKDWVVLGPLDPLDCPRPPRDATDLDWGAAWKDRGGEARHWRPLAMQAARVARATRHFYDLGEALLCPQGAVCAATLIHAGRDGGVGLELAHEGRAELWLNGQPLEALDGPRYTGHLRAGDNLLWVRLEGVAKRGRGFHLSVSDPSEGARALTVRLPTSSFEMTA